MLKTGSEYIAMAKHTGLPESGADNAGEPPADHASRDLGEDFSQDFEDDVDPASASPPARFGRLALWAASASALSVGVAATVAYGVWFDQDQRAYAKAMTVAQQALSASGTAAPGHHAFLTGGATAPEQQAVSTGGAAAPVQPTLSAGGAATSRQQTLSPDGAVTPQQQLTFAGEEVARQQQSLSAGSAVAPAPQTLSAGEADALAQQALSIDPATAPTRQTAWSGRVAQASPSPASSAPPTAPATALADAADADLATPASPAQPESPSLARSDSVVPHSSTGQPGVANCSAKQDRHRPAPHVKPNNGLFARMGSFFHRVSYRQHGNGSHRDVYSHP
jgi:hypothetical protein